MRGFLEYRPDGIILVSPRLPAGSIATVAEQVPMVVVGRRVRADGVDSVMTDEDRAAHLVIEHLRELGHERAPMRRSPEFVPCSNSSSRNSSGSEPSVSS